MNQVASIDLKTNTFTVDFWVWFRGASAPVDSFELIDGRINSKTNVIKKTLADGQSYGALFVSVIIAWCAFFIRPKDASPKVSVSVGALFAAAAATVAINSQLPDINYATISDLTVFLTLGMISVSLIATVGSLALNYMAKEAAHRRLDRVGGVLFPLVYVALLVWVLR